MHARITLVLSLALASGCAMSPAEAHEAIVMKCDEDCVGSDDISDCTSLCMFDECRGWSGGNATRDEFNVCLYGPEAARP